MHSFTLMFVIFGTINANCELKINREKHKKCIKKLTIHRIRVLLILEAKKQGVNGCASVIMEVTSL